ncbi:hypothetical protein OGATHE_002242 [Ogataea polymorpha]|uniref:Uncharacterized protein n=1 Tax=Ogataea polymorpha TaxID=460523 RepID=A0A9P8PJS9_9ASCO|nr:hypothetical protein OGATHE_002242 [Ogataea polymorpha]
MMPAMATRYTHVMPAAPVYAIEYHSVPATDGSSPSVEKATANVVSMERPLLSSCLYPRARITASSWSTAWSRWIFECEITDWTRTSSTDRSKDIG